MDDPPTLNYSLPPMGLRRGVRELGSTKVDRWDRRACLAMAVWALALGFAAVDLHHVVTTWWMGSDFQPVVLSVVDLVHDRPFPVAFVYPPGLLVLGLPLLLLQHGRHAEDLGLVVEMAGLVIAFWCMARLSGRRLLDWRLAALALALVLSAQVTYALQLGNLTLLLILAAALFYLALDRDRPTVAGVVLGLSLVTKPMLLPLIVPLLSARHWRATIVAVAIPTVLSVLTLPFVDHPASFIRSTIGKVAGGGATSQTNNVNLIGLAHLWHLSSGTAVALRILAGAITLIIAWQLWRSRRPELEQTIWTTQLLLCGLLLCFSLTHSFYPLLLLPLAFVALQRPRSASSIVALAGIALSWMPFQLPGVAWAPTDRLVQTIICAGMAVTLAAGGLAVHEARRRPAIEGLSAAARGRPTAIRAQESAL